MECPAIRPDRITAYADVIGAPARLMPPRAYQPTSARPTVPEFTL